MVDLAGLGIAVVIHFLGLKGPENLQCGVGKFWIDQGVLQRDDQAVASERGDEPRETGGWQEDHMIGALDRQPKSGHVLEGLAKQTIKFLVARVDLDHVLEPVRHRLSGFRFGAWPKAISGGRKMLVTVCQRIEEAAMP